MASFDPAAEMSQRRQFVILRHDHPQLHWDFLIEDGEHLASWRLLEHPETGRPIPAEPLPPHRRHYLTWEGPVSGNRGSVSQVFSGWLSRSSAWPPVEQWPELTLSMEECPLGTSCRLRHDPEQQYVSWEFFT